MKTGATNVEIEAAAKRMLGDPPPKTWDQGQIDRYLSMCRKELIHYGQWLVPDGWRLADPATVAAMQHLIDAWSEFAAVPGPWAELETVRTWLDAVDAGGGDGN